jgi:hypothetical protein
MTMDYRTKNIQITAKVKIGSRLVMRGFVRIAADPKNITNDIKYMIGSM